MHSASTVERPDGANIEPRSEVRTPEFFALAKHRMVSGAFEALRWHQVLEGDDMAQTKRSTAGGTARCLLMFSGGLDSTFAARQLSRHGYEMHLRHGTYATPRGYGGEQTLFAQRMAKKLGMPFDTVGAIVLKQAVLWNPLWLGIGIHLAAQGSYDAVAFGAFGLTENDAARGGDLMMALAHTLRAATGFKGRLLFPTKGVARATQWRMLPAELHGYVWTCHNRQGGHAPCGRCIKCTEDAGHRRSPEVPLE